MAEPQFDDIANEFRQALIDCRQLYHSATQQCVEHHPAAVGDSPQALIELMEDLGKGLVMKIYSTVAQADRRWSREEAQLAEILFETLCQQRWSGEALREATLKVFEQGDRLRWYSLVRPFEQIAVLRERIDELETIAMRLANVIAKCDGTVSESEAALVQT